MFKGHGGYIKHFNGNSSLGAGAHTMQKGILDFSASINPLGYPENVRKVITECFDDIVHYPDIDCTNLRECIARKIKHSMDEIIVGNGSTELFYLIPRTLKPARGLIFQPTFSEFAEALKCSHAEIIHTILREDNDFRLEQHKDYFHEKNIEMAFVCNPNNPTGQLIEKNVLLNMIRQYPRITFVVDEAFIDFVEEPEKYSVINEAGTLHNLVVVRSLTKFYGFPGLRIGYLVAHADGVRKMMEYKEPWSVNTLAQLAAMAALEDGEFTSRSRGFMFHERWYLFNELAGIHGLSSYKPTANYIFLKINISGVTSPQLRTHLLDHDIAIRDCSNFTGLNDTYFRVAVKTREENIKLLIALKKVFSSNL